MEGSCSICPVDFINQSEMYYFTGDSGNVHFIMDQKCGLFLLRMKQWPDSARKKKKKTRSYLDRSPSGMKRFMNHVDAVESGPYSTYTQGQTVIVCMCICVWRETLLYLGSPWLCVCLCVHVWPTLSHSRRAPFYS